MVLLFSVLLFVNLVGPVIAMFARFAATDFIVTSAPIASVDSDSGSSFGGLPCHCSEDILVDGIVVAAAAAVVAAVEAEGVVEDNVE